MSEKEIRFFADPAVKVWIEIFEPVITRGKVGFDNGIHFLIHTAENGHSKPHLHATYKDKEISLEIPSGKILAGNLPANKATKASHWVIDNQEYLKQKWNELTNCGIRFEL